MQLATITVIIFLVFSILFVGLPALFENFPNFPNRKSGIFKSSDGGINWFLRANTANVGTIERKNILDVSINAQDPKNIYLGTKGNGLFTSFDFGETWAPIIDFARQLDSKATVNKVLIDQKNPGNIYLSVFQNSYGLVLRSNDGGRSFETVYTTAGSNQRVLALAMNLDKPNRLYLGTSNGGFFESEDYGFSWKLLRWFDSAVNVVYLPANDPDIYIGAERGLFKTGNRGASFVGLNKSLNKINHNAASVFAIASDPLNSDIIYIGTRYGILRSKNGGLKFETINILIPANFLPIETIEVDPTDSKIIYVGAGPLVYKSIDAGLHWSVEKLPTANGVKVIKVNPAYPREIFLGIGDRTR